MGTQLVPVGYHKEKNDFVDVKKMECLYRETSTLIFKMPKVLYILQPYLQIDYRKKKQDLRILGILQISIQTIKAFQNTNEEPFQTHCKTFDNSL